MRALRVASSASRPLASALGSPSVRHLCAAAGGGDNNKPPSKPPGDGGKPPGDGASSEDFKLPASLVDAMANASTRGGGRGSDSEGSTRVTRPIIFQVREI